MQPNNGSNLPGEAYDRFMGRYSMPLAVQFAAFAEVGPSSQVLDVGCGPGALTGELVRLVGAENVLACDPSEPFVAACAARHPGVDVGSVPPSRCRSATTRPTRRYCRAINK